MEHSGARLKHFLQIQGIKQKSLAEQLGKAPQYINAVCSGRTTIGKKLAMSLQEMVRINAGWLLTGEGNMLHSENSNVVATPSYMYVETRPRIPLSARTGNIEEYYAGKLRNECEEKPVVKQFADYDFTLLICMDVMAPYIDTGDIIACAKVSQIKRFGRVYVLDTEGEVLISRVYEVEGDDTKYKLVVDNSKYQDLVIDRSDVKGTYKIVGLLRPEI